MYFPFVLYGIVPKMEDSFYDCSSLETICGIWFACETILSATSVNNLNFKNHSSPAPCLHLQFEMQRSVNAIL